MPCITIEFSHNNLTNKKKDMRNLLFIATIILALTGCKKEEVAGPQGVQGPQGEQGNANVESFEFTLFNSSWEGSAEDGYAAVQEWDVLTEEMVNEGGIFVYWQIEDNTYSSLPLTLPAGNGFLSIFSGFRIDELSVAFIPASSVTVNNPGVQQFRAIAIAPKSMALGDDHVQKLIAAELSK